MFSGIEWDLLRGSAPQFLCLLHCSVNCVMGWRRKPCHFELCMLNRTGSDVRIRTGHILNPRAFPRQSVASSWWEWSKVFAYRWSRSDHINSLELRSIIHAVEWRVRHLQETQLRIFHLTDSYVAMSLISKGRTSSRMFKPLLSRLAILLLAMGIQLVVCHVESSDNPTDDDSRK